MIKKIFFYTIFISFYALFINCSELYSQYIISGNVYYSDNNAPVSNDKVYLLYYNSDVCQVVCIDSTILSSSGNYYFQTSYPDSILICVGFIHRVGDEDHVGTYYPSTIDWMKAQPVYPPDNPNNINISVQRILPSNDPTEISGTITILDNNNNPIPLSGVTVIANQNSSISSAGYTDANGNYTLDSLVVGPATIYATKIGFCLDSITVIIGGNTVNHSNIILIKPRFIKHNMCKVNPNNFYLSQNSPNPFNPNTTVRFTVPAMENQGTNVKIVIYDILGKEVAILVDEYLKSGKYEIKWNGSKYTSGIYFYCLIADNFVSVKRMILLK